MNLNQHVRWKVLVLEAAARGVPLALLREWRRAGKLGGWRKTVSCNYWYPVRKLIALVPTRVMRFGQVVSLVREVRPEKSAAECEWLARSMCRLGGTGRCAISGARRWYYEVDAVRAALGLAPEPRLSPLGFAI